MIASRDVPPSRKMKVDDILKSSFNPLLISWAGIFQWAILTGVVVLLNLVPITWIFVTLTDRYIGLYADPSYSLSQLPTSSAWSMGFCMIVLFILDAVYSYFTAIWFLRLAMDGENKTKRQFSGRWLQAVIDFKRLFPMYGTCFLLVAVFSILYGVLLTNLSSNVTSTLLVENLSRGIVIIVYLLTLVLSAKLFMGPYLVLEHDLSFIEAFKKSWQLTTGRTFKLIAYILVFMVMTSMISMPLSFIFGLICLPVLLMEFNFGVLVVVVLVAGCLMIGVMAFYKLISSSFYLSMYRAIQRENTPETAETSANDLV